MRNKLFLAQGVMRWVWKTWKYKSCLLSYDVDEGGFYHLAFLEGFQVLGIVNTYELKGYLKTWKQIGPRPSWR
jgi:hypothetical protein